jgi:hypothetical protein
VNWILDNLQLVVIVASAFAWWLSQRKKPADEDPASRPDAGAEQPPMDLEQHTRKIQDEIRRKIAERRGEAPIETGRAAVPPPIPRARPGWDMQPRPAKPAPRRETPVWTSEDADALVRQQRLEEQMRTLVAQRRAVRDKAQEAFDLPASPLSSPLGVSRHAVSTGRADRDWLVALKDRRSLRQAIVLREILGPPVALRRNEG